MTRYVVFREYLGVDVFYVEAATPEDATERIFPDPPGIELVDRGDDYAPYLSAQVRDLALRAVPVRRFPPRVWVVHGPNGEYRDVGARGEPAMRHRGAKHV